MTTNLALAIAATLALLAGCVSDDPVESAAVDPTPPAAPAIDVSFHGETERGAFACASPLGFCYGVASPGSASSSQELVVEGTLVGVDLTMTWDAVTPATQEMIVGIAYGSGSEWKYLYAYGASPLRLSETGLAIPGEDVEVVYANAYRCASDACASTAQPFDIEGVLHVEPIQP